VYCCDGASWQQTGDAPLREEVRQRWQMFTIVHVCKAVFQVQSKTAVATLETSSLFGRCCTNDALDFQLAAELPTRDFITIPKILNPVKKAKQKEGKKNLAICLPLIGNCERCCILDAMRHHRKLQIL
jgi:hypothetical protein